jgi:hypothetical protein
MKKSCRGHWSICISMAKLEVLATLGTGYQKYGFCSKGSVGRSSALHKQNEVMVSRERL